MTITIRATYYSGGEGTLPDPTLTAPTLVLSAVADTGSDATDKITNTANLVFNSVVTSASITDALTWRLYKNGIYVASTTATGTPVTFAGVSATEGTADWTATLQKADTTISYQTNIPETVTVDLTAPTLSSPSATTISPTAINISVTTNTANGELRYVVLADGAAVPTSQQVWDHTDGSNNPAVQYADVAIASTGAKTATATSLANSTAYDFYWTHKDAAGNLSSTATATATTFVGSGHCIAYDNWLLRVDSGLPTKYKTAYGNFFDALTTAGLFATNGTTAYFDALYIGKTYDQATAIVDLSPAAHNLTLVGTPTFTANVGWTGGAGKALDTGFGVGLGGTKYTTTSAHAMTWNESNTEDVYSQCIGAEGGGGGYLQFFLKEVFEHKWYFRINSPNVLGVSWVSPVHNPSGDCRGMACISRSGSTVLQQHNNYLYSTWSDGGYDSPPVPNIMLLSGNSGILTGETSRTHSAWSIGAYINNTQITALYSALAQFWLDIA